MKGLLKYLSPFAPDLAGAVSALFEFNGLIVICDAGGCTGNICGFDEPRWFTRKSALFSAGLRDMDAILGRDNYMVDKLIKALPAGSALNFAALIGSPVPAVIATDFNALRRMTERRTNMPILTVEASGTKDYDEGASSAYMALFKRFAVEKFPVKSSCVGVLGVTPLDFGSVDAGKYIRQAFHQYREVRTYGMDCGLDSVIRASEAEKNIVVSPAGLKCAKYLESLFGTPYEVCTPLWEDVVENQLPQINRAKVLVIHQQFAANAVRERLQAQHCEVTAATFFAFDKSLAAASDTKLNDETALQELVYNGNFDVIIADNFLQRVVRDFKGKFIDLPHFAISGRLVD